MTSHPTIDVLHVYAETTNEDATQKVKAYTEVSTTEDKDDVLVDGAAKEAVKERGAHTAALRQLEQNRQPDGKQMQNEVHKEVTSLMENGVELHEDNHCSMDDHMKTGLCFFEHVTGRPMSNENLTSDSLVQTDERLSLAVHNAKNKVLTPPKGDNGMIMIQKPQRSQRESRWKSPLQNHFVADGAVKVQSKEKWINASQWDLKLLPRDEG